MIPRVLEPEVMDTADEAREYDAIDHREVNARFADDFQEFAKSRRLPATARVLDLGTGTALIPIEICRRMPEVQITAIDLAAEMLVLARRNVESAGLISRITLLQTDAKSLGAGHGPFDAVVSNSIVHHIPEPLAIFQEAVNATRPDGLLFMRDLLRPETEEELQRLVALHAAGANERQRLLLADSLRAALTLEELREILIAMRLPSDAVTQTSDRHWTLAAEKKRFTTEAQRDGEEGGL